MGDDNRRMSEHARAAGRLKPMSRTERSASKTPASSDAALRPAPTSTLPLPTCKTKGLAEFDLRRGRPFLGLTNPVVVLGWAGA